MHWHQCYKLVFYVSKPQLIFSYCLHSRCAKPRTENVSCSWVIGVNTKRTEGIFKLADRLNFPYQLLWQKPQLQAKGEKTSSGRRGFPLHSPNMLSSWRSRSVCRLLYTCSGLMVAKQGNCECGNPPSISPWTLTWLGFTMARGFIFSTLFRLPFDAKSSALSVIFSEYHFPGTSHLVSPWCVWFHVRHFVVSFDFFRRLVQCITCNSSEYYSPSCMV